MDSGVTVGLAVAPGTGVGLFGLDGAAPPAGAFGVPAAAGAFETAAGGAAPGCCGASFVPGWVAFTGGGPAAGGGGGAPLVPGTGSELAFGNAWPCGSAFGAILAGGGAFAGAICPTGAPALPAFAAGFIDALGGIGSLPCWISEAFCATAGGSAAVAPAGPGAGMAGDGAAPLAEGTALVAPGPAGAG